MSIFVLIAQIISRSDGRSTVASSAYRSSDRLVDARTGEIFNFKSKSGVVSSEILAPVDAPAWMHQRSELWNSVEQAERRRDSQLARELILALPYELNDAQRRELVHGFVRDELVSRGMVAEISIHRPSRLGDQRNHHSHVQISMRRIQPDSATGWGKKAREWNDKGLLAQLRKAWADHQNEALSRAGRPERVDHRSLVAQGINRVPLVHVGNHSGSGLQRNHNCEIAAANAELAEAQSLMQSAQTELVAAQAEVDAAIALAKATTHAAALDEAEAIAKVLASTHTKSDLLDATRQTAQGELDQAELAEKQLQAKVERTRTLLREIDARKVKANALVAKFHESKNDQLPPTTSLPTKQLMDRAKADLKRIDNEIPKLKNRIGQIKTELEGLSPMWFLRVRRLKQERDNLNQRLAKLQRKRPGVHRLAVQNCVEEAIEIARKRDHQLMYVKAELKKDNEQADILGQAERELKEQLAAAKLAVAEAFERLRIAKMSPAEHVAGQLLSEANFELIEDLSLPHSLVESEAEQRSSMERPRGG